MTSSSTSVVVLAAGNSSRLGVTKQLLPYKSTSLLRHTCETALGLGGAEVLVVLGFDSERMRLELKELAVNLVVNQAWEEGMSSSVKAGINSVSESSRAALIMLCDQPLVPKDHYSKLIASCSAEHPVTATLYGESAGVPACFERGIFPEFLGLAGDSGARSIVQRHRQQALILECPEAALDVDTNDDYQKRLDSPD